jgi:hypothetical protein
MSSLEQLHPTYERQGELAAAERLQLLDFDGEVERLAAASALMGPIATMFAFERPPAPMPVAEGPVTAETMANTVEFLPVIETQTPEWRAGAERDVSTAAIMFAWERPDAAEYDPENLALAA